ncbi:MAG: hypothetical protein AAFV19_09480 [Pseudomonadota bacterium]
MPDQDLTKTRPGLPVDVSQSGRSSDVACAGRDACMENSAATSMQPTLKALTTFLPVRF